MPHNGLHGWIDTALTWLAGASLVLAAYVGRLTYHTAEVRAGRRRFWSWHLLLDLPTAAGMALAGWGLADVYSLSPAASHAVAGVLGYLGPRGIEVVVGMWLRRRQPAPASESSGEGKEEAA